MEMVVFFSKIWSYTPPTYPLKLGSGEYDIYKGKHSKCNGTLQALQINKSSDSSFDKTYNALDCFAK